MSFKSKCGLIIAILVLVGIPFMYGCANSKTKNPEIVGVDTFSGVVSSIETIETNVFLVVSKDSKDNVYYASTDSDVATEVLKLNVGDYVDIKYVLGTPQKYKEIMAMPLSNVKVIK